MTRCKFWQKKRNKFVHWVQSNLKAWKIWFVIADNSRSYFYNDNLLCHENNNMLTNDWAVFDIMIVASGDRVVITTHQNLKMLKSWGAQRKPGTNGNVGSALKTTHAKTTGNDIPYLCRHFQNKCKKSLQQKAFSKVITSVPGQELC